MRSGWQKSLCIPPNRSSKFMLEATGMQPPCRPCWRYCWSEAALLSLRLQWLRCFGTCHWPSLSLQHLLRSRIFPPTPRSRVPLLHEQQAGKVFRSLGREGPGPRQDVGWGPQWLESGWGASNTLSRDDGLLPGCSAPPYVSPCGQEDREIEIPKPLLWNGWENKDWPTP